MSKPAFWFISLLLTGSLTLAACAPVSETSGSNLQPVQQAVETQLASLAVLPTRIPEINPTNTQPPTPLKSNPTSTIEDLSGLLFAGSEYYQILSDGSVKTLYPGQIQTLSPDQNTGLINSNGDFWLVQFDTQTLSRLTMTENRVECCATWWNNHPDKILFLSNTLGGNQGVATNGFLTVIRQDGSGYMVLDPDHPTAGVPAVSPDGVWIAYGYGPTGWLFGGELGPQKIDPADYGLVSLKGQNISNPSWSPDGRHLAWFWQSDLNSGNKVGVLILDMVEKTYRLGALYTPVSEYLGTNFLWSPDGKWLTYIKTCDQPELDGAYLIETSSPNLEETKIADKGIIPQIWSSNSQKLVLLSNQTPNLGALFIYDLMAQSLTILGLEPYQAGTVLAWGK